MLLNIRFCFDCAEELVQGSSPRSERMLVVLQLIKAVLSTVDCYILQESRWSPIRSPSNSLTSWKTIWSILRSHPHPTSENTHWSAKEKHKTLHDFQGRCYGLLQRLIFSSKLQLKIWDICKSPHCLSFACLICVVFLCGHWDGANFSLTDS